MCHFVKLYNIFRFPHQERLAGYMASETENCEQFYWSFNPHGIIGLEILNF
jgi:hypothetical protein